MIQIVSCDGTKISAARSGHGPALLLVHGTTADHTRWGPVLPALERRCSPPSRRRRNREPFLY